MSEVLALNGIGIYLEGSQEIPASGF